MQQTTGKREKPDYFEHVKQCHNLRQFGENKGKALNGHRQQGKSVSRENDRLRHLRFFSAAPLRS